VVFRFLVGDHGFQGILIELRMPLFHVAGAAETPGHIVSLEGKSFLDESGINVRLGFDLVFEGGFQIILGFSYRPSKYLRYS